ncbi:unnamed protein product [[Candida] boidinii]|nr:unnamed protein product [[Candida] boidinii]
MMMMMEIDKLAIKNGFDSSKVASLKNDVKIDDCSLEQLSLVFTLPGYLDVNLCEGNGENIDITFNNLAKYIDSVVDITIGNGVLPQAQSFVEGFSKVFPYSSMIIFNPKELVTLLGSGEEDWSFETLISIIRADHGYTTESPTVRNLLELMSQFNSEERRKFLQFLTGSPRLPVGGFKSLNPELTVVLKHSEDGLKSDDYLPSVMTCANYLKLPDYSSKEVLKRRLKQAVNEGAGSFLLS